MVAWSPLGSGVLWGKYARADIEARRHKDMFTGGRAAVASGMGALSERHLTIVDTLKTVAEAVGHTPAQTAIAWLLARQLPTVIPIRGVRTAAQFEENLGATELDLTAAQIQRLNEASAVAPIFPHSFLPRVRDSVRGGASIRRPA